jgi:FkbM family methyltransferase
MLISLQEILAKYDLKPKGVIHAGAHWAEEHDDYVKCGIERFVYIEPCRDAFAVMCNKFNINSNTIVFHTEKLSLFNYACGSEEKEEVMYVSHQNQGQSNSLLKPEGHLTQHPEIIFDDAEMVKVVPLDNLPIQKEKYDMLVLDVQGFEGEVLKGATETLKHIDIIYTEVNRGQTYAGNMEIDEMDSLLAQYGFERKETFWPSPNWTWGDCVYLKTN